MYAARTRDGTAASVAVAPGVDATLAVDTRYELTDAPRHDTVTGGLTARVWFPVLAVLAGSWLVADARMSRRSASAPPPG